MRALLLTVGSQGDVQPFVALAARLRDAGHDAVLAAAEDGTGTAVGHLKRITDGVRAAVPA